jgi:hypothetical protein
LTLNNNAGFYENWPKVSGVGSPGKIHRRLCIQPES